MADTPRTQLERAYRLIQQERLDEASALLQPLVKQEPNNADAWWLLANAVTEPDDARNALENVLRLTPNHPEARDLLDQLKATVQPSSDDFGDLNFDDPFAGLETSSAVTSAGGDVNALFDDDEVPTFVREGSASSAHPITNKTLRDFSTEDDEALLAALDAPTTQSPNALSNPAVKARSGSPATALSTNGRLLIPLGLLSLLVIIALLVVVVILPALKSAPAATTIASVPTSAAAVANTAAATSAATTFAVANASPVVSGTAADGSGATLSSVSAQIVTQLQTLGIVNPTVSVVGSSVGQTLTARFCGPYGPKLDAQVRSAMDILAAQGALVSSQVQGVGVEVDSCSDATQLYARAIAAIKDVADYANKVIAAPQFRSSWKTS